ncbi:major histocompatibility complex class I-related gene protein-like isoform X1 [Synchiropus splendidus]|uniref:major histocompatibility complex class I-related gene protein-like isoform X1 n=1 Tax=Synchiropus splendidus TaxID=270530 RepID=UPI00237DE5EE|nr:major histocompatibility complex class I-related gene protein-like isoform X1 [Synchiropus splendidus]
MRIWFMLAVFWINGANSVFHSLTYWATASSQVHHFPEYVEVGLVDGVELIYYDNNSRRVKPKQDWMTRLIDDDPEYLERETQRCMIDQQTCKTLIKVFKGRFNQIGGVHTLQVMHGCEWDDETGEVRGYYQYAYDGEDFIALDLKTLTWIAAKPQAVITKLQWDNNESRNRYLQSSLSERCPELLKQFLHYGKSSLLKTELPSVSLLQKTPSSPIICLATGFYPPRAILFWTKDGEELLDDVNIGEVLPNPDGTYQMMAELKLSDPSEDWERFTCVFQLAGVKEDLPTNLDKEAILTNRKLEDQTVLIAVSVAAVVVVLLITAAAVIGVVKRRRAGRKPITDSNSSEEALNLLIPLIEAPAHGESLRNILKETREEKLL